MLQRLNSLRHLAARNYLKAGVAAVAALPMIASAQTDPFTEVMTDVTDKVTTYAGALVVLAGVSVVYMVAVKYVKKIRGAS